MSCYILKAFDPYWGFDISIAINGLYQNLIVSYCLSVALLNLHISTTGIKIIKCPHSCIHIFFSFILPILFWMSFTLEYYKQIRFSCIVLTAPLFWCHVQNKWAQWIFSQLYKAQQCSAMKFPRKSNKIWKAFIPFSVSKCHVPKLVSYFKITQ